MLHGNPLLRGWTVTDVSFYTTELPEYMIVEAVRGLNADVLHVSAAITYTLVVLTGGLLGRGRASGREGIVRMLIAAGIMVAPQFGPGVFILVFQPDHTGTAVPLMLTWLVLDRAPRQLVRAAHHRGDAGLGRDRRPAGPAGRGRSAGRGVRHPRLPGR